MRFLYFILLMAIIGCKSSSQSSASDCEKGITKSLISRSAATKEVDTISEKFHRLIREKYLYPYAKDCRDSIAASHLFNLLMENKLLSSDKILSVEILPRLEETIACQPFIYAGNIDSANQRSVDVNDTALFCNRTYNYPAVQGIWINWKFCEPLLQGYSRYKLLSISHRSLKIVNGHTLIIRIWYKNL